MVSIYTMSPQGNRHFPEGNLYLGSRGFTDRHVSKLLYLIGGFLGIHTSGNILSDTWINRSTVLNMLTHFSTHETAKNSQSTINKIRKPK